MAKIEKLKDRRRSKTFMVLHISSATSWRGGENQIELLLNGLQLNCDNFLLCPRESPLSQKIDLKKVTIHTYKKNSGISYSISRKVQKICSSQNIHIIHAHDNHAHNFALGAALLGCKLPIVVTRRVDFKPSLLSLLKYNHRSIKKVVCVSNAIKNILKERGVRSEKLATIHSGVNLQVKTDGRSLRKELNIPKHQIIVGFIGAFVNHKDPMTFLKMASLVLKESKNYHFIMVGHEGERSCQMKKYINENKIQKSITVLGFREEMSHIWETIDTLVISSYKEGLGTVALESFHNNTPVVSTNAGGLKEIVQNGVNALVVERGDYKGLKEALLNIFDNTQLKVKLLNRAKSDVMNFDYKKMSQSYLDLYEDLQ